MVPRRADRVEKLLPLAERQTTATTDDGLDQIDQLRGVLLEVVQYFARTRRHASKRPDWPDADCRMKTEKCAKNVPCLVS